MISEMNWDSLLSTNRLGTGENSPETENYDRSEFQRDYDRIIFSSPFRRMQNKTQVFPLPERIFVHNRLTHSLEVASVGRSLGNLLSERLTENGIFTRNNLHSETGAVVSAACLAHDMGNPPFGHSGETAISNFFLKGSGKEFRNLLSENEWNDFTHFDGNANAFRVLTHRFEGKREGGFALTYTTLASIVKYPFESGNLQKQKFGFFQSEKENYKKIACSLGIPEQPGRHGIFCRHPLVYLVEAADDICYQIMDVEDAFKLKILSYEETSRLYLSFYEEKADCHALEKISRTLKTVTDPNEQVSYLRAGVISKLVKLCASVFWQNHEAILGGHFGSSLIKSLPGSQNLAMEKVKEVSVSKIYNHRSVVEIEIAGYKIIGTLLEEFIGAMMNPSEGYSKKLLSLVPRQYLPQNESAYLRIQSAIDFISGMTDLYALDLYRKIKGISLPEIG